jgi:protein-tyrosine phosphatase
MSELGPGPIPGSYWVQDQLVAGEYPGSWTRRDLEVRIRQLVQLGVTCFIDLTEEGEKDLQPYAPTLRREAQLAGRKVEHRRMPIPDYETPTVAQMRDILSLLDAALAAGHTVYLHCYAGIGRTGTVVGCFLVRNGWTGEEALDEIVQLRRWLDPDGYPSPITPEQRQMVRDWARLEGL